MLLIILVLVCLLVFYKTVDAAVRGVLEAVFGTVATLEERLLFTIGVLTRWFGRSGLPDPALALVGLFLVALTAAVSYADYTVLLASLGLIWPTDAPPAWLAFSIVGVTVAVGMLTHSVASLSARVATIILACTLIGGQGMIAYMRTAELTEVRSIVDAAATAAEDGALVIAGGGASQSAESVNSSTEPAQVDRSGPVMAAGIAIILCLSQIAAAWGAISLAGGVLAWVIALPVLLALWIPWIALRVLSASGLRGGLGSALDAIAATLKSAAQIPAQIAPFPWTDASLRRRLAWKRRVLLADLQDKEDAGAGRLRASVEQELRDAEIGGFREFTIEYARQRRILFNDLLQEAFNSARRENLEHVPDRIVRMWFWPLDKAWHLMTVLGGEARFPTHKAPSKNPGTKNEEVER